MIWNTKMFWGKSHCKGRTWPQQAVEAVPALSKCSLWYWNGQLGNSREDFLEEVGVVDRCGQTKENREALCYLEYLAFPAHSYLSSTVTWHGLP